MKRILVRYATYPRTERIGIAALAILIALFTTLFFSLRYFVKPPGNFKPDERFAAAWASIRAAEPPARKYDRGNWKKDTINFQAPLFAFDPNVADSPTLLRLGFTPRLAHGLLNWRAHGKHFYKREELQKLYNLPPEFYARLVPYIAIAETGDRPGFPRYDDNAAQPWPDRPEPPKTFELNTVDSQTLVSIRGIGPYTAHRILEKRGQLGGFLTKDQLREIYGLRDSTLAILDGMATVNPAKARRLNLNTVTIDQLRRHPYVGEKLGQYILMYRDGLKGYKNVEQLRQAPTMDEAKYRKIAPYFTVE